MATQQPFINPRLPFTGMIRGGLIEGKTITLFGRVLLGAERFHVNLQGNSEIALHFNPRYSGSSGFVVCNTRQHTSWGSEERQSNLPLPRGSDFTLAFLVNRDSYSVILNGTHLLEFRHRISISRVNVISVDGGVDIHSISFQNPVSALPQPLVFQHFATGIQKTRKQVSQRNQPRQTQMFFQCAPPVCPAPPPPYSPSQSYVVPYKTVIQGGLYPGRHITVQGLVNHDADRFCINLRYNSGIAFHFNPRFNENTVVRNSQLQERWGAEERVGGMPFSRGQSFTVTIVCDTQCYKIIVNGVQMFSYIHRHFTLQQIDILEVQGNVSLNLVSV